MAGEKPEKPDVNGGRDEGEGEGEDEGEGEGEEGFEPGGWRDALELIPLDQFTTPQGMVGVLLIILFELLQAVLPPTGIDLIVETGVHLILIAMLAKMFDKSVKQEIKGQLAPLAVGLIPGLSDAVPEWLISIILPFIL